MQPRNNADPIETLNREQQDDAQVLDVNDMVQREDTRTLEETERGGQADPSEIAPDDRPDLVETGEAMFSSGQIDNGAYVGERNDDDEESMLGDTEDDDDLDELDEDEDALIDNEDEIGTDRPQNDDLLDDEDEGLDTHESDRSR